MKTTTIELHPQFLFDEDGKPKSVLLDYKVYQELLEILEDFGCEEIIQSRLKEPDEEYLEA
ncbi:MAG: hypothetical protein HQ591_05855 [candidate division Zixibacteria bacterium]|nr:hypothetical protein [Candidatus Tariuqbacter arcticus]